MNQQKVTSSVWNWQLLKVLAGRRLLVERRRRETKEEIQTTITCVWVEQLTVGSSKLFDCTTKYRIRIKPYWHFINSCRTAKWYSNSKYSLQTQDVTSLFQNMNPLIGSFCGSQISSTGGPLKSLVFRNFNSVLSQRRNSVIGIATRYGLGGLGIESRWVRDFPRVSRPFLGPTQPPIHWVPEISRVKWPGCGVDHSRPSNAEVKERVELHFSSSSGTSWAFLGWTVRLPFLSQIYLSQYGD
jgi:hypothetical protein